MKSTIAKKLLFPVVLMTAIPGIAAAESCNSLAQSAAKMYNKAGEVLMNAGCASIQLIKTKNGDGFDMQSFLECYKDAHFYTAVGEGIIAAWNDKVKKDQLKIGPRALPTNTPESGTITSLGSRVFLTPPIRNNSVNIAINERDGKNKTKVVVCKHDANGKSTLLTTRVFNENKSSRKNKKEKQTIALNGVKGDVISIKLQGKKLLNNFSYTVSANE